MDKLSTGPGRGSGVELVTGEERAVKEGDRRRPSSREAEGEEAWLRGAISPSMS